MNKVTLGLVFLVVLLGFLLLTTDNGCMNMKPGQPSLNVSSAFGGQSATVKVSASESRKYEANEFVTVAMLELRGRDKELLYKQLEARRQAIFEQMNKLDIQNTDIEQNSVDMRKEWSYDKGTRSLTGYVVSQSFAIRCSSRPVAAAAVAVLSAELDVEIDRTTARLKSEDSLRKELVLLVGKKALDKAGSYAESVGGSLGKVISVSENGGNDGVVYGRTVLGAAKFNDYSEDAMLASIADSVSISASVHLVVELIQ
jgi:hypothetical protein